MNIIISKSITITNKIRLLLAHLITLTACLINISEFTSLSELSYYFKSEEQ